MKWVLDTNIVSYLLRGNSAVQGGFNAARQVTDTLFILSPVVDYEIRRYLLLKRASRNLAQYEALTAQWVEPPFDGVTGNRPPRSGRNVMAAASRSRTQICSLPSLRSGRMPSWSPTTPATSAVLACGWKTGVCHAPQRRSCRGGMSGYGARMEG